MLFVFKQRSGGQKKSIREQDNKKKAKRPKKLNFSMRGKTKTVLWTG